MYSLFEKYAEFINIYDINIYDIPIQTQIEFLKLELIDDPLLYLKLPSYLKNNKNITDLLVNKYKIFTNKITDYKDIIYFTKLKINLYNKISYNLLNDKKEIIKIIKIYGNYLKYINYKIKQDREIIEVVEKNGYNYSLLFENYGPDDVFKFSGDVLEFANEELQNDRDIVLEAFEFVNEELQNDRDIVLEAFKRNGNALEYSTFIIENSKTNIKLLLKHNIILDNVYDILYILIKNKQKVEYIYYNISDDMKKLFSY